MPAVMRIGNQTAFSAQNVMLPFDFAVVSGFDAFEWFPDKKESGEGWSERDMSAETRTYIRETAAIHDIRFSVHAPWPSNPMSAGAAEPFLSAIGFAKDIGASLFNIHIDVSEGTDAYVEAIAPFLKLLGEAGMRLSIENTPETGPDDFNELFGQLRKKGILNAGICLDIGHANLYRGTRNEYLRFVDMLGPQVPIIHLHMHENYGDQDSHLTLFTGPAGRDPSGIKGLIGRLNRRDFSGLVILEQWPQPESLLIDARNRLLDLIRETQAEEEDRAPASHEDILSRFVDANRQFLSWRKRLDWVREQLVDGSAEPVLDLLVYTAVYLRFLGTGEVRCSEDGGHYRPSNHAKTAQKLYRRLISLTDDSNFFVIRKIYPWLPSFDSEFMRAEPLTRIRDIAHRNDIPGDLKQEIKTRLQNKLHRSAGPEDLTTSEDLLNKITAPDRTYPEDFVREFRKFHEELKDFFHAGSLRDQLEKILEKSPDGAAGTIRDFIAALGKTDDDKAALHTLELLTKLRSFFAEQMQTSGDAGRQRLQLADIRLESFSFVLLSRLINYISSEKLIPWEPALDSLRLTIENLRLSGFDYRECEALVSELRAWSLGFNAEERFHLLRLKATIDRCRRLADSYCNMVLALFPEKAERLGIALGVSEHALRVFAEDDIRGHPVFQMSKLVAFLLKNIRSLAGIPAWDIAVPGNATGKLIVVSSLKTLSGDSEGPLIVLCERMEGEEEIPARVSAIIVIHEIPLLSHIAVRARQKGIVFVICEEADRIRELRNLSGKPIKICVTAEDVKISETGETELRIMDLQQTSAAVSRISPSTAKALPLEKTEMMTGGAKAYGARRLEEISRLAGSGFKTPGGLVVPFGIMEASFGSYPLLREEYVLLVSGLNNLPATEIDATLKRMQEIVLQLPVPDEIIASVKDRFREEKRFMVRSSSNCEDLEGLSGAGLYDTVANAPADDIPSAISKVWSSLWNRRAVESRKNAGISHKSASMAVLVQPIIIPEFSFILHTVNPISGSEDEVYIELAVGMGEILASAEAPGVPFRMTFNKAANDVRIVSFASFSYALQPGRSRGVVRENIDYSRVSLSSDQNLLKGLGSRIGSVASYVEKALGKPQDIEGLITGDSIYLVQSRPQAPSRHKGRKECLK